MALVVFLRGVNVGGHNTFRPSVLARDLAEFDIVNIGAAGTFVVHRPGPQARFRAALVEQLPFDMSVALCEGRDVLRLEHDNPFEPGPAPEGVTRFVSILAKRTAPSPPRSRSRCPPRETGSCGSSPRATGSSSASIAAT
jgi:uncharacterized protein (DUF1697 family)